jgi:hypothetical protein
MIYKSHCKVRSTLSTLTSARLSEKKENARTIYIFSYEQFKLYYNIIPIYDEERIDIFNKENDQKYHTI